MWYTAERKTEPFFLTLKYLLFANETRKDDAMNEEMQEQEVTYQYLETPEAEMAVDGELTVLNTFLPVSEEPYTAISASGVSR